MTKQAISASASLSLLCALALSGCGVGLQDTTSSTISAAVQGHIMGGQQPVFHASVRFYAASTAGYGHAAIAISSPVTSLKDGSFSLTSPVDCSTVGATAQTYVVATSGNPGLDETSGTINNTAIALVAALGDCNSLNSGTFIQLNEITTVAAAWALAPFAVDPTHIGASSTNTTGLANAFGMAANLASYSRGTSPGDAPTGALVPSDEVNTMANILASCVNTKGYTVGDKSSCDNLFTDATPPITSPTAPTNTFTAALDIAKYPGNNAALIAALPVPQAPFGTSAGYTAPTDWTMAITFPIGLTVANNIAIDSKGDIWSVASNGLYELSPTGAQQTSYPTLAGNGVAVDPSNNVWVTLAGSDQVGKLPANLSAPAFYNVTVSHDNSGTGLGPIAIDGSGDVWYTCIDCTTVNELTPAGAPKATSPNNVGSTGIFLSSLSIDTSERVYVGNINYTGFDVLNPDATRYAPTFSCVSCGRTGFIANDNAGQTWFVGNNLTLGAAPLGSGVTAINSPSGGIFNPAAVAIDGNGSAWVANTNNIASLTVGASTTPGSISEFDTTGAAVSPNTGYASSTLSTPQGIAIDASGNVWLRNTGAATVTAFVGAATPVATPFSLGLSTGKLGQEP